jgi:hypothetical protein
MENNRRDLFKLAAASGLGLTLASGSALAQEFSNPNLVTVGVGGDYPTIQEALDSISGASEVNPFLVYVYPGLYDLSLGNGPIRLKPFVNVCGIETNSVRIICRDDLNIRASSYATLSNLTIYNLGTGNAIVTESSLWDFNATNLQMDVRGGGTAFKSTNYLHRVVLRATNIVTDGTGIHVAAGGHLYSHDTNLHLVSTGYANPHYGIRAAEYCRIYLFGGKLGTGYGYPDIDDPLQDVVGVIADSGARGRIKLFDVWSICRQELADATTAVNCIRVEAEELAVRIHGGYFQAETPGPTPEHWALGKTISSPGGGRIEIHGARVREYGDASVYSANQIGASTYTAADGGAYLEGSSGGLLLCDATDGTFAMGLPYKWTLETAQYIFKKIDNTGNWIYLYAPTGDTIEGEELHILKTQYETLQLRKVGNTWYRI